MFSIELFHSKVSAFIPLLRPGAVRECGTHYSCGGTRYEHLEAEDAIILYGMLALSARFSSNAMFKDVDPSKRGELFAAEALAIYEVYIGSGRAEDPSFKFLQGCILLAFYYQTSKPTFRSRMMVTVCCRLAYDLELNRIDELAIEQGSLLPSREMNSQEWTEKEDRRRAWWLIWELDIFASTIHERPSTIDVRSMQVYLPAPDNLWLSETFTPSIPLHVDPLEACLILNHQGITDERVWFLLCTYLMKFMHDLILRRDVSDQEMAGFESAVDFFTLSLPAQFQLCFGHLEFNEENFARANWVVSTHLMLNT